ncbi:MAG: 2-C-methyl-D-erythritol 2,4-cyclodiphosphate synthase [bacterium]
MYRIGQGYDLHRLTEGRKLILGGVEIPHKTGLLGHSDADVLVHAIMDALLGALALGDIGKHFPPSDQQYKGISSILLLEHVKNLIEQNGYKIVNIDSTIVAEQPKMISYIDKMRQNIAKALDVDVDKISVKATTTEGLMPEGEELAISSQAVCLLEKI